MPRRPAQRMVAAALVRELRRQGAACVSAGTDEPLEVTVFFEIDGERRGIVVEAIALGDYCPWAEAVCDCSLSYGHLMKPEDVRPLVWREFRREPGVRAFARRAVEVSLSEIRWQAERRAVTA